MTTPSNDPRDKFNMRPGDQFQPGDAVVITQKGRYNGVRCTVHTGRPLITLSIDNILIGVDSEQIEHAEVYDFHVERGDAQEVYG